MLTRPSIYIILPFCLCLLSSIYGNIINIPTDTTSIQAGIDLAGEGDTVLVANGLYYENIDFKGKHITVASHFLTANDTTHIENTIINGSQPANPDTGSVVRMISGEDTTSVLCGFTITGGSGTVVEEQGSLWRLGGGILCRGQGGRIKFNIIENNEIISDLIAAGGGISVGPANLIDYMIMENNHIRYNRVFGNMEWKGGGGIFWGGDGQMFKNKIHHNECSSVNDWAIGGGIRFITFLGGPYAVCQIDSNLIYNNLSIAQTGNAYGGGINADGHRIYMKHNVIMNNIVQSNQVSFGAGLDCGYLHHGVSIIEGNYIVNNINQGNYPLGGGMRLWNSDPLIQNNIIAFNQALYGGGILSQNEDRYTSINNTIVNNSGGGIQTDNVYPTADHASALLINTIVWNNSGVQIRGDVTALYCNIEEGWPGRGNISSLPYFSDSLFHLSDSSFCIGLGRRKITFGDSIYYAPLTDFEGNPRPNSIDTLVDIGADESPYGARPQLMYSTINQNRSYIDPVNDSLHIGMRILNPHHQNINVSTRMTNLQGTLWDEQQLFDDGSHGDSSAADNYYAIFLPPVIGEDAFRFQHTISYEGTQQTLNYREDHQITSIGPIICQNYQISASGTNRLSLQLTLRNQGQTAPAEAISAEIVPRDNWVTRVVNNDQSFGSIAAGDMVTQQTPFYIDIDSTSYPGYLTMNVIIKSNGYPYWQQDNILVGIEAGQQNMPRQFVVYQNYPNPFNPSTNIEFSIPEAGYVTLKIYNILGEEISTLLSASLLSGSYKYIWDANNLASGIYLYRLEAGNYATTKKMILIR
jgi:hypothetical protein